jgi:UDP-N-acetylglucosamine--N-acetylmuramyl-(pentapeptide) pyrophosphoryl-undecaprenol N-acetylglucosamine transferase
MPKVLIATGGTGGHLFPAQAFARELKENAEILFTGANLASSRCFYSDQFAFKEISSGAIITKNPLKAAKALWKIGLGVKQAAQLLGEFRPNLIIGFGSFHAAPLLFAALLKKVPIILFEANSKPGKVNRLFSRFAKLTAIQFPAAKNELFSETALVDPPLWAKKQLLSQQEARLHYGLKPDRKTILVFGGSLGAKRLNTLAAEALTQLKSEPIQLIHLSGSEEETVRLRSFYAEHDLLAVVKNFEHAMYQAWSAASLVICRAGAATIAEQIAYEVPGILIPYPAAADDHQTKNAEWMQDEVKGAYLLPEHTLKIEQFIHMIEKSLLHLDEMKAAIHAHKEQEIRIDLANLILEKYL